VLSPAIEVLIELSRSSATCIDANLVRIVLSRCFSTSSQEFTRFCSSAICVAAVVLEARTGPVAEPRAPTWRAAQTGPGGV